MMLTCGNFIFTLVFLSYSTLADYSIPSTASPALRDLLFKMLTRNSRDRINFEEFFNHEFLAFRPRASLSLAGASSSSPLSSSPSSKLPSTAPTQLVRPSAASGATAAGFSQNQLLQPLAATGGAAAPSKIPSAAGTNLAQPPPFTAPKPPVRVYSAC